MRNLTLASNLLVTDKITVSCQTNIFPETSYETVTNNENELWKTVRLTASFQKPQRFNLLQICPFVPLLHFLCYLASCRFLAVIFMFHSSLIFLYPFAPYHKADWAVWKQTAKRKSVIDIHHANQLLTQALVLLTHEASKLESIPHSHALKHWSFIVQKRL